MQEQQDVLMRLHNVLDLADAKGERQAVLYPVPAEFVPIVHQAASEYGAYGWDAAAEPGAWGMIIRLRKRKEAACGKQS